jgi:LDH2 family malate/lactate/ureidoglycolate dehydrogenase
MDVSNTVVARGKAVLAEQRNQRLPEGWAVDSSGRPITDPTMALEGLFLPMAGHKGYVIAFMMDVLAGVLTGSSFATGVASPYQTSKRSGCGHLSIALSVSAFMPARDFEERIRQLIKAVKSAQRLPDTGPILYPGELEDRSSRERRASGITISDKTMLQLGALARSTGVPLPSPIVDGQMRSST